MDHVFPLALASFSRGVKLVKSEGHSLFFTLHFSLANRANKMWLNVFMYMKM